MTFWIFIKEFLFWFGTLAWIPWMLHYYLELRHRRQIEKDRVLIRQHLELSRDCIDLLHEHAYQHSAACSVCRLFISRPPPPGYELRKARREKERLKWSG